MLAIAILVDPNQDLVEKEEAHLMVVVTVVAGIAVLGQIEALETAVVLVAQEVVPETVVLAVEEILVLVAKKSCIAQLVLNVVIPAKSHLNQQEINQYTVALALVTQPNQPREITTEVSQDQELKDQLLL